MANITPQQGCWIQYQLKLNGHGQKTGAKTAGCSVHMVSHFLRGNKDSERVRLAFCKVLGYENFSTILARVPESYTGKGGAA